mmetsp:Transcript_572/g.1626  ORF Transcript_572/g.1626 Transcript_572/m.1626 type:complete len:208 (+) Transcript_572:412-1035(+)
MMTTTGPTTLTTCPLWREAPVAMQSRQPRISKPLTKHSANAVFGAPFAAASPRAPACDHRMRRAGPVRAGRFPVTCAVGVHRTNPLAVSNVVTIDDNNLGTTHATTARASAVCIAWAHSANGRHCRRTISRHKPPTSRRTCAGDPRHCGPVLTQDACACARHDTSHQRSASSLRMIIHRSSDKPPTGLGLRVYGDPEIATASPSAIL